MRDYNNRNSRRDHHSRRNEYDGYDEFNRSGMEDGWRNEDFYFDRNTERRGFSNRDYSGSNYWPVSDRIREEHVGNAFDYTPEFGYGPQRDNRREAEGYGNSHSPSMGAYNDWREADDDRQGGYRGSDSRDYRYPPGSEKRYYNPSDYDERGMRRNPDAERFNRLAAEERDRRSPVSRQRYDYDEYESYPTYRSAYDSRDDEWHAQSQRHRNEVRDRDHYENERRRPNIREKRY